uniref:DNA excision repair protein ERCC-5 n=1 Tax=Kwoniella pini CBS 10737 TaxID=1296096 RepID=A0A1B9I315_9TREE|nr:DNA excision repair protein ERCC-5 [Kwoniella pini CBS 10737]OCF49895.1 DNA excision repair protein ERCC-5 [Kwoniella pini CBS 10737]
MGVKGLWSLLNPVSRPVQIESMEGKRLAIDSSIWLYQFQATMRDKDGRVLVNAHVLGFLRRINKLLFHGIKPVFVFDGGAPALKRATIAERKKKKAGAAANHAKVAEKLFAAQMRREAVKAAQASAAAASRYPDEAGEQISENAVYLDELEGRASPTRSRPAPIERASSSSTSIRPATPAPGVGEVPTDPEKRRKYFKKLDPYKLPEATMPSVSTTERPDARLATEEELKQFIDEVSPDDIDIESPEFRALPTEVQYEIIGDLRVRSRQQSHKRLTDMLRAAPSALDFSKAQIKHLSQRNALTQQLLTVTDMVGKAHLTIPIRIAAERNREYVLVKRGEDQGGGWALGIREGSKQNPIQIEEEKPTVETESESSGLSSDDSDIEEIESPQPKLLTTDKELREQRRREILEAIARRYAPARPARKSLDITVKPFGASRQAGSKPLFDATEEEEEDEVVPTANDEALALALQQEELGSDEEEVDEDLARALALSRVEKERRERSVTQEAEWEVKGSSDNEADLEEVELVPSGAATPAELEPPHIVEDEDEDEFEEVVTDYAPSRTQSLTDIKEATSQEPPKTKEAEDDMIPIISARQNTARMKPAGVAAHRPIPAEVIDIDGEEEEDDAPLFISQNASLATAPSSQAPPPSFPARSGPPSRTSDRPATSTDSAILPELQRHTLSASSSAGLPKASLISPNPPVRPVPTAKPSSPAPTPSSDSIKSPPAIKSVQRVPSSTVKPSPLRRVTQPASSPITNDTEPEIPSSPPLPFPSTVNHIIDVLPALPPLPSRTPANPIIASPSPLPEGRNIFASPALIPSTHPANPLFIRAESTSSEEDDDHMDDTRSIEWSPSPPPVPRPALQPTDSATTIPSEVEDQDGDITTGDMAAEEDDYARFLAQIKGRDLNEVRTEIDDEIRILNSENRNAMRDSDEITQSMIMQIQTLLRHFGIPYITAPMEAEAQCAKLAELGLVDGIITDDSDVFLFGGIQCFKNIFNDAKYAECFLSTDIERELSLTRERLISLAYLLGSDYTIGLPGVGPVVALELLANFPGPEGIDNFKEWWMKVQRGIDQPYENDTKWKLSFKKRYKDSIYLLGDWPNPLVREAYKYPTTDESEEPFHWGFPKLSALRTFLHEELSWSISKVDDELTPIVQRIARRGKLGALNKQATLLPFFDVQVVTGNYAPRRRTTANVSKRLMGVIKSFREAEAKLKGEKSDDINWGEMMVDLDEEDPKGKGTGKRRKQSATPGAESLNGETENKKRRRLSSASVSSRGRGRKRSSTNVSLAESEASTESGTSLSATRGRGRSTRGRNATTRGKGRGGKSHSAAMEVDSSIIEIDG